MNKDEVLTTINNIKNKKDEKAEMVFSDFEDEIRDIFMDNEEEQERRIIRVIERYLLSRYYLAPVVIEDFLFSLGFWIPDFEFNKKVDLSIFKVVFAEKTEDESLHKVLKTIECPPFCFDSDLAKKTYVIKGEAVCYSSKI